ncbi:hypothetical protein AWM68_17290 [Fictibacillus phosphorivorans]|uniref:Uncharacterized protein n=1 Tax=Fictibacillus phosphorivorans TaxID=1221500 RepID=A0A163S103_9BACL|nr:hypothetical protein [Fictibacillus phosphorivorans]KZE67928.1 hypothetical protein AWM68_17290 [Fictibacillus phosphorivorans]
MSEKNYHSRLLDISKKLDHVIEKLKTGYIDQKNQPPWFFWLLLSPFRDLKTVSKLQKGVSTFLTSEFLIPILPLLATVVGIPLSIPFDIPGWVLPVSAGVIGYGVTMYIYFKEMLNFNSKHFHLGAYSSLRKQEYDIFKPAFLDPEGEFYFKGVYDFVTASQSSHTTVERLIREYLHTEKTSYEAKIRSLEDKIKDNQVDFEEKLNEVSENSEELTKELYDFIDGLVADQKATDQEFEYVIELIKDINTLLFRIHNKGMTTKDLNILTGFTLYELKGSKLVQIEDVNTSGVSPDVMDLDDPKYKNYGAVKVINDNLDKPIFNAPYTGHIVVSHKMRIDQDDTWVYNFHFDESNTKAWHFLVENATLESREIYRLVHALCLLTLDFKGKKQKGAVSQ